MKVQERCFVRDMHKLFEFVVGIAVARGLSC